MFKKKLAIAALAGTLVIGAASFANAQTSRLYFAGYLGLNTYGEQDFAESTTNTSGAFQVDNTTSFGGALGLRLNRNLRAEAELSYRNAEIQSMNINGFGNFDAGGEFNSTFAFLNLYYDVDVPWKIKPFVGGGVGYGWHDGEISDVSGIATSDSGSAANFAYNIGGGLKYRPRPDMAFTGSYRYVDSFDLDFGTYEQDYNSHEFRIGVEWDLPVR
ncbi:MAG: outer membrane beta-barrel protein [Micavibrio sp.]|nr:outer membrane beta-barrel protein [Micavibrio sp.]